VDRYRRKPFGGPGGYLSPFVVGCILSTHPCYHPLPILNAFTLVCLAKSSARIFTPTFIPPDSKDASHYSLMACPTLFPGHVVQGGWPRIEKTLVRFELHLSLPTTMAMTN
jgi:hypothetical protein